MKRRTRRNPHGTLLVNPRRKGGKKHAKRRSGLSLKGLISRVRGNPRRHRKAGHRRNPLLTNPRRSRHGKRHNPLLTNPRRSRRAKRHNPLLTNPIRIKRRRNPSHMLGKVQAGAQKLLRKIPLAGGILAGAVGVLGSALGGALGVYPTAYAMPYVGKYLPSWLKPFGYTIAGAVLSALIEAVPYKHPMKSKLAIGVAAAGGAVDAYRYRHGKSQDLGDEGMDSLLSGDDETGDSDEVGDDGSPLAASEYADADLGDCDYMGDDLSDAEIAAAELGRRHYWKKFKKGKHSGKVADGVSDHAGKPGLRHACLIYWIGFDQFQKLAKMPESERKQAIQNLKREAKLSARKLLSEGSDTSVAEAEMAGLLVA